MRSERKRAPKREERKGRSNVEVAQPKPTHMKQHCQRAKVMMMVMVMIWWECFRTVIVVQLSRVSQRVKRKAIE